MSALLFLALVAAGGIGAGILGALTGEGGGILLVPVLVLLLHVNLHNAAGASIIAVTMTSTAATVAFLRQGYTNIRVAMFLQLTSIAGGIVGALLAAFVPVQALMIVFGVALLYSAYLSFRRKEEAEVDRPSDPLAIRLGMESSYPTVDGWKLYTVQRVMPGSLLMGVAGIFSGLLGIGAGAANVLVMDQVMKLPYKVSTTTSNFMVGITAAASVGIYFRHGYIDPFLTMAAVIGIFAGALVGARLLMIVRAKLLRLLFSSLVLIMALEMIYKGALSAQPGG